VWNAQNPSGSAASIGGDKMRGRLAGLTALLCAAQSLAAPSAKVTVDKRGALRIPQATLKALQVKPAKNGMVCLEFALPPATPPVAPDHPGERAEPHVRSTPVPPARFWVPVSHDGTAVLTRSQEGGGKMALPGAPGTAYLAIGKQGHVVLKRL